MRKTPVAIIKAIKIIIPNSFIEGTSYNCPSQPNIGSQSGGVA
jgi:hypothetical protein